MISGHRRNTTSRSVCGDTRRHHLLQSPANIPGAATPTGMNVLLISDLHLDGSRPEVTAAFHRFLQHRARRADRLYILGDLFEAWIGDDDPSPLAREVTAALLDLGESGTSVLIQHGNRDFLLGQRFAAASGAELLDEYHLCEIGHQRALLCHGDALCTDDLAYMRFRRKVRHPVYRWLLERSPLRFRQRLAARWRERSAAANANKPENIMDVNARSVRDVMRQYGVDTLIHGHTHRPARHELDLDGTPAQRLVLGDWHDHAWWVEGDETGFRLKSEPIAVQAA